MTETQRGGRGKRASLADISLHSWAILGAPDVTAARARRFAEVGLRAGTRVFVLLDTVGGGRVISVGDRDGLEQSRIALDRNTLRRLPATATST
jgi:hypothetical protein